MEKNGLIRAFSVFTGGTGPMPLLNGLIPGDVIELPELKPLRKKEKAFSLIKL